MKKNALIVTVLLILQLVFGCFFVSGRERKAILNTLHMPQMGNLFDHALEIDEIWLSERETEPEYQDLGNGELLDMSFSLTDTGWFWQKIKNISDIKSACNGNEPNRIHLYECDPIGPFSGKSNTCRFSFKADKVWDIYENEYDKELILEYDSNSLQDNAITYVYYVKYVETDYCSEDASLFTKLISYIRTSLLVMWIIVVMLIDLIVILVFRNKKCFKTILYALIGITCIILCLAIVQTIHVFELPLKYNFLY